MIKFRHALVLGTICMLLGQSGHAQTIFSDSFESGTKMAQGMLTWQGTAGGVSISTDWASTGKYSMKFPYVAKPEDDDDFVEQRFSIGTGTEDLWIRFKLKVPTGYYHRNVPGSDNNKFFKISSNRDSDSAQGVNLMWEYWPTSDGGSRLAYHWTNPDVEIGEHKALTYVFGPKEAGQVLEFVLRARMSSKSGVKDGIVQTWVRSSDSAAFKQIHNETAAPMYPSSRWPTQTKWVAGYILGWANSSFGANTTFYIDDLRMSSSSLLDDVVAPKPPGGISVQ